jgi:hypothetical protein
VFLDEGVDQTLDGLCALATLLLDRVVTVLDLGEGLERLRPRLLDGHTPEPADGHVTLPPVLSAVPNHKRFRAARVESYTKPLQPFVPLDLLGRAVGVVFERLDWSSPAGVHPLSWTVDDYAIAG